MDQKELIGAAVLDLNAALTMASPSAAQVGERLKSALQLLSGSRIDAFAARETLQGVERRLLDDMAGSKSGDIDRLLHAVRAADQKLTAALSAGHYSEG